MEKIICTLILIALSCLSGYVVVYCATTTICETTCCPELLVAGAALALMMMLYFLIDAVKFIWKGGKNDL